MTVTIANNCVSNYSTRGIKDSLNFALSRIFLSLSFLQLSSSFPCCPKFFRFFPTSIISLSCRSFILGGKFNEGVFLNCGAIDLSKFETSSSFILMTLFSQNAVESIVERGAARELVTVNSAASDGIRLEDLYSFGSIDSV